MNIEFICQYCGKKCKNKNSLSNHERLCKLNLNRQYTYFSTDYNKTRQPTNQFIKAKKEGRNYIVSNETRIKNRLVWLDRKHKLESKEKTQETINKLIENNNWHNNNGIKIKYKNNYFDSSWEVEFVKYLDSKNIEWIRPKNYFNYKWNNSNHRYYPDIYIPKYDLYIEIKALPNERDYLKWEQFTGNLDIYDSKDLFDLGILNVYDKRNLIKEEFRIKHINL